MAHVTRFGWCLLAALLAPACGGEDVDAKADAGISPPAAGPKGIEGSGQKGIQGSGLQGIQGTGLQGIEGTGRQGIQGSGK
jgi:hypothetical protein